MECRQPKHQPSLFIRWPLAATVMIVTLMSFAGTSLASSSTPGQFLTGPNTEDPLQTAAIFLLDHQEEYGLTALDLDDYEITSEYRSEDTGTTHIALRQRHGAIGVHNAILTINIARDGSLMNLGNRFVSDLASRIDGPDEASFGATEAVSKVANLLVSTLPKL